MKILFLTTITFLFSIVFVTNAYSENTVMREDYIRTGITYPDDVVRGSDFNISFFIENTGSYERNNATMQMSFQSSAFESKDTDSYFFERITGDSSYGQTYNFVSLPNATLGLQFINIDLSHVNSRESRHYSTALPITIIEEPKVIIKTEVADSIYSDAEFPFIVQIESRNSNLRDISVTIVPPDEITFRGQTLHTFSSIDKDMPISLRAEIITTSVVSVDYEHYIPFQVFVKYTDESDTEREISKTISVLLKPKGWFEIGAEGGFWIGDIYIAPTISIGTLIGISLTTIIIFYNRFRKKRLQKSI